MCYSIYKAPLPVRCWLKFFVCVFHVFFYSQYQVCVCVLVKFINCVPLAGRQEALAAPKNVTFTLRHMMYCFSFSSPGTLTHPYTYVCVWASNADVVEIFWWKFFYLQNNLHAKRKVSYMKHKVTHRKAVSCFGIRTMTNVFPALESLKRALTKAFFCC